MLKRALPFAIPPGQHPPFATITETDHGAWIIVATAIGLSFILLFGAIKVFMRWNSKVGMDELCLAASTIIAAIQSSVVLGACSRGLGKSIELLSQKNQDKVQQMFYVSILLFIISLGLSKLSVAFLLRRISPQRQHARILNFIIALIAAWTVASLFALSFQCNLSHPWKSVQEECPRAFLRWQVISAFDIAFELSLLASTIHLVWKLQTSVPNKVTVVSTFASRLPLIIAIAFRLKGFNSAGLTTNPTFLEDKFIIWTQVELNYSIIAVTIPSLRPFIRTLATNFGADIITEYGSRYNQASDGTTGSMQPASYHLTSFRPKGKGDEYKYRVWSKKPSKAGPSRDRTTNARGDAVSIVSSDSQRMIIKKDLTWEVVASQNVE